MVFGCSGDEQNNPNNNTPANEQDNNVENTEVVKPGQTRKAISKINYLASSSGSAGGHFHDGEQKISLCEIVSGTDSLAIVEITTSEPVNVYNCDNPNPYRQSYRNVHFEVLAVAGGQELPVNSTMVLGSRLGIEHETTEGDFWLLGVNEVGEELYLPFATKISINQDEVLGELDSNLDLPRNFDDLSRESIKAFDNFSEHCSGYSDRGKNDEWWFNAMHLRDECQEDEPVDEEPEEEHDPCDGSEDCP